MSVVEPTILAYKPCRLVNSYFVEESCVKVLTFTKLIKLDSAAKVFWLLADGKHTLQEIIDSLSEQYPDSERKTLYTGVLKLMANLQERGVLITNWDPILKEELPQGVTF